MVAKKRKPIDLMALASVALPQRDPVVSVQASPPTVESGGGAREAKKGPARSRAIKPTAAASGGRQASRMGKVGIQFWTDPSIRKSLRHYATETDSTLDQLLGEAVADLMRKHKIA